MMRRLLRRRGGSMPRYQPQADEQLVTLSGLRPLIRTARVCLTKDCQGETRAVETWGGQAISLHGCKGRR